MRHPDLYSLDLFGASTSSARTDERAGTLACGIEIVATINEALEKAKAHGVTRETVAERMGYHLGEKFTLSVLVCPDALVVILSAEIWTASLSNSTAVSSFMRVLLLV